MKAGEDVVAAARRLDVMVTEHAGVVTRAQAAVKKIEGGLRWAQRQGVLSQFNDEYRRRRLAATARGERFMSYGEAQARLRKALAGVAAGGELQIQSLFEVR
jgi:hypothetical protein